jgi:oligosaccharide repeat unit polymerase
VLDYWWVLPLSASCLSLSDLQTGLVPEAVFLMFTCTGVLAIVSAAALYQVRGVPLQYAVRAFNERRFDSPEARILVAAFFAITLAAVAIAEFSGQGIPILEYLGGEVDRNALHRHGKGSQLQILGQALVVAGVMALYIAVTTRSSRTRATFMAMAMIVPVVGILKTSKTDVFLPALYYSMLFVYLYRAKKRPLPVKSIAAAGVVLLALFALITTIRIQGVSFGQSVVYSDLIRFRPVTNINAIDDTLAVVYGYTALSFQNFSNFVSYSSDTNNWGTSLLRPFYSLLVRGDVPDTALQQINWYFVSPAATVGTYLRDLYAEGGAVFCVLGSFVYALFINSLYVYFRRSGAIGAMFLYIIFSFAWSWLFFHNVFSVLGLYINAFYIVAICVMVDRVRVRGRYTSRPMPI